MSAAVTGSEFVMAARYVAASAAQVRSLMAEQRHQAAREVVIALRRLARTILASQADHGFSADLVLGDALATIEQLHAEVSL